MGAARYFDAMNLGHAVAHELAAARDRGPAPGGPGGPGGSPRPGQPG